RGAVGEPALDLDGERAERREAAQEARAQAETEQPGGTRLGTTPGERLEEQPERERADDVHHERRHERDVGRRRDAVPGDRAERTTEGDDGDEARRQVGVSPGRTGGGRGAVDAARLAVLGRPTGEELRWATGRRPGRPT